MTKKTATTNTFASNSSTNNTTSNTVVSNDKSKKIKSYIVKENTIVNVIRFNTPNKLSDGYTYVDELVTDKQFGFESSYVITKSTCTCCDEVSYIFDHHFCGPVEIKEQDLIMTELSIDEYRLKYPSVNHTDQQIKAA